MDLHPPKLHLPGRDFLARYMSPSTTRSIGQLLNTLLPWIGLWWLMVQSLSVGYWLTLLLAIPAAGLAVRLFILFHDCGHGSFFRSRRANEWVGFFTGVLVLTPHHMWWRDHNLHHAGSGNLEKRGTGDIWTMTVREYREAGWRKRLAYRLVRNPACMLLVGPLWLFGVNHRLPSKTARRKEKVGLFWHNLVLAAGITVMCLTIGWKAYVAIHVPILMISGAAGIWLFYVQHQFEDGYYEDGGQFEFARAAVAGSSYYKLPWVLQWFTGNIGFHHIHHLSPRIPNYLLEACHRQHDAFRRIKPVTLRDSWRAAQLRLWCEERKRLVDFREAFELPLQPAPSRG